MLKKWFGKKPPARNLMQAPSGNWYSSIEGFNALDEYVRSAPSEQAALDLFKGEWSCAAPEEYPGLTAGAIRLDRDSRVFWAADRLGGFEGRRILELGPLEAAHTFMLEKLGAASILSIEANKRAFVKCLLMKNLLGLSRSHFLLGDFVEYLRAAPERFDCVIASGVLYHMVHPVEVIGRLADCTDRVFVWTHYDEPSLLAKNPVADRLMTEPVPLEYGGFRCVGRKHLYGDVLQMPGFCGGPQSFSVWLKRDDLAACFRHFGFPRVEIGEEEPNHSGGPALCLAASKV